MATSRFRSGNGAAWLDLLVTLAGRYRERRRDQLSDPAALDAWLAEFVEAPATPASQEDLELARDFREALHAVVVAAVRGEAPEAGDLGLLNELIAADAAAELRLVDGRLTLAPPDTVRDALARLARDAARALGGPGLEALHFCGDGTCSGVFSDRTGRRRWCSDESCGNRMRVRAHREARRAAGSKEPAE